MKYSITYIDNTTIVVFSDNKTVIIDENLKGWKASSLPERVVFTTDAETRRCTVWSDGGKFWYQHGEFHRDGGPAVINCDGEEFWYHHGRNSANET